jgi:hypothetical protein
VGGAGKSGYTISIYPGKKKILREDADRFDMPETGRSGTAGLKEHPAASTSTSKTADGSDPRTDPR